MGQKLENTRFHVQQSGNVEAEGIFTKFMEVHDHVDGSCLLGI